ncbi:hypothetical protein EON82_26085, partial [bacterium]
MTRSIFAAAAAFAFIGLVTAPGCKTTGVGDPCTPEQEYDKSFGGFAVDEVNVESKSFQCQTRLCLVNHFQGRVTCPYGQSESQAGPVGADGTTAVNGCLTPAGIPVDGKAGDTVVDVSKAAKVEPQCTDRTADKAVYCSCRCANVDGKTDDGASYCSCPDGFACEQLVTSIGALDTGLTGAYCIK